MKKFSIALLLAGFVVSVHSDGNSAAAKRPLQSNVGKGVYIHNELVSIDTMKKLPIPLTNEDYAFYQSIGKASNIVIGKFKTGEKAITLISDKNADGNVDFACTWNIDEDRVDIEPRPADVYSAAKFTQMKDEIINGKSANLSPNPEGAGYMRVLLKRPSNISRMRNGYRVTGYDSDEPSLERVSYFFSNNGTTGVDLAFEVKYNNMGTVRVKPLVSVGVYCKDSFDPFAVSLVEKLTAEARTVYAAK